MNLPNCSATEPGTKKLRHQPGIFDGGVSEGRETNGDEPCRHSAQKTQTQDIL